MKFTTSMNTVRGHDEGEFSDAALMTRANAYLNLSTEEFKAYIDRIAVRGEEILAEDDITDLTPPYIARAIAMDDTAMVDEFEKRRR